MERLTEKHFWERNYSTQPDADTQAQAEHRPNALNRWIKNTFGTTLQDHSQHLLWDVIMAEALPRGEALKVVEIGSAPGLNLLWFHEQFGYAPYGIEYTERGAAVNRHYFVQRGLDPEQVIHADAFSPEVLERYGGQFDVVASFGFIEHFDDVPTVIQRHLDLLKEGGWLVIQIPRLSGFNYWIARLFNRETLPMHNLQIMQKSVFQNLFTGLPVQACVCDYVGVVRLHLCLPPERGGWQGALINAVKNVQALLNIIFHRVFPRSGGSTSWFSPYLVFIGKKVTTPSSVPAGESVR